MSEPKFKVGDLVVYQRKETYAERVNGSVGIITKCDTRDSEDIYYSVAWVSKKFTREMLRDGDLENGWSQDCFEKIGEVEIAHE